MLVKYYLLEIEFLKKNLTRQKAAPLLCACIWGAPTHYKNNSI